MRSLLLVLLFACAAPDLHKPGVLEAAAPAVTSLAPDYWDVPAHRYPDVALNEAAPLPFAGPYRTAAGGWSPGLTSLLAAARAAGPRVSACCADPTLAIRSSLLAVKCGCDAARATTIPPPAR